MLPRLAPALACSLALLAASLAFLAFAGPIWAGSFSLIQGEVDCSNGTTATVTWVWYVDPDNPPEPFPQWVGYDVYRRSAADCGPYVRLNPEIIPKAPVFQTLTWEDSPPSGTTFEYYVDPVDAQRQHVSIPFSEVNTRTWTTCPELSAPITVGRLVDWGWALFIQPCSEGCWPAAYFDEYAEPWLSELRTFAGTQTVVRFFGEIGCCTVEGAVIGIDHYELGSCGPTPAARTSWGQLKAIYR